MKNEAKREEKAVNRLTLVLPLLDESLDKAARSQKKKEISKESGVSERTLERYIASYREKGFDGLKPEPSIGGKNRLPKDFDKALAEAEKLRREVPGRSVNTIINILEYEGVVKPGELKRSTLQDHLAAAGLSAKQMRIKEQSGLASRRFQKIHRCQMYQGDIKYGPYLPIGPNGKKVPTYLSVIIDDATRYVVAAKFYDNMTSDIIEDSLRNAVMAYGLPDTIYFDNGKQYRNKWIKDICAKLGIRLIYTKPFSPEAKGKVEAFNRTVGSFFAEAAIEQPKTLTELNHLLDIWLSEHYHKKPHSALNEKSPEVMFKSDSRPLKFPSSETLKNVFLHHEERNVDKTGCFKLRGKNYEAGMEYIGKKVEIRYDPHFLEEVEVLYPGFETKRVKKIQMGEFCESARPRMDPLQQPDGSRLLEGLKKQADKRQTEIHPAIKFSAFYEEKQDD